MGKIGCDANKDCIFTEDDWIKSSKMCLPFPGDLCKLKSACDVAEQSTEDFSEEQWAAARETCAPFTPEVCHKLEAKWAKDDALAAYKKHMAHLLQRRRRK